LLSKNIFHGTVLIFLQLYTKLLLKGNVLKDILKLFLSNIIHLDITQLQNIDHDEVVIKFQGSISELYKFISYQFPLKSFIKTTLLTQLYAV
jgi:hypothetical protein